MEKGLIIKEKIEDIEFDYGTVDEETGNIMKEAVEKIYTLKGNIKKSLGEEFSKVQDKLAGNNQYDGIFGKWYSSMGFKKDFVYDCINYYKVLIANYENKMIQDLSFSKVCEVAKIKKDIELQKEVIEKAPLKEMKVKQVAELVKEVNSGKKVTDELINKILQKDNGANSSLKNFLKATNTFIDKLKEKNISKEDIKKVLELVNQVQKLCIVEKNSSIKEEV